MDTSGGPSSFRFQDLCSYFFVLGKVCGIWYIWYTLLAVALICSTFYIVEESTGKP